MLDAGSPFFLLPVLLMSRRGLPWHKTGKKRGVSSKLCYSKQKGLSARQGNQESSLSPLREGGQEAAK